MVFMPVAFVQQNDSNNDDGLLVLVVTAVFLVGLLARWQDDTWWLLRTGFEIWRTWQIPQFDSLAFSSEAHVPLCLAFENPDKKGQQIREA